MLRLGCLFALICCAPSSAGEPWRHIPSEVNMLAMVENPKALLTALREFPPYQSGRKLPAAQEALAGVNLRRLEQLLEYYEREMGQPWPELLEAIAGGGIALGAKLGDDPAPSVLVVEGRDEASVKQFFTLATKALEEEMERNNPDDKLVRKMVGQAEVVKSGKDFFAARRGRHLFVANKDLALELALKCNHKTLDARWQLAQKITSADTKQKPLMTIGFDLAGAKSTKASQDFFAATRQDVLQNLFVGSTIDAARRADIIAVGLHHSAEGWAMDLRMPAKRADLPSEFTLHVPPTGQPGSLPLLEPPGVLYSQSFTLDLSTFWRERAKFVNPTQLPELEKADKDISKLFSGPSFGKILEMSGPYHRFVAMSQSELKYKSYPSTPLPPMALVSSMRDPKFGKSAVSALRGAAFALSIPTGMAMSEETHEGIKIVKYLFPEDRDVEGDEDNLRFNFAPAFAVVNDSLVVASEASVIKALIPELKNPKTPDPKAPVWRGQAYAAGAAEYTKAKPEAVITNLILTRNLGLEAAKAEVEEIIKWLPTLGQMSFEIDHTTDYYQARFRWALPKAGK
ncbi:MAG: hypothetical protein ACRC8S_22080 [Fimbriiglobus sp.]